VEAARELPAKGKRSAINYVIFDGCGFSFFLLFPFLFSFLGGDFRGGFLFSSSFPFTFRSAEQHDGLGRFCSCSWWAGLLLLEYVKLDEPTARGIIGMMQTVGVYLLSTLCIYLGYKLYWAGASGAFQFAVQVGGFTGTLLSVGPGLGFAACGMFIAIATTLKLK
jgi:hypothetical protein